MAIERKILERVVLIALSLGIGGQVPPWSSQLPQAVSEQRPTLESTLTPTPELPKPKETIIYNRFVKSPCSQRGDADEVGFKLPRKMDNEVVESLKKKTPDFQSGEAYEHTPLPESTPQPTPENKPAQYRQEFNLNIKPIFLANKEKIENLRINGALGNLELLEMYYPIYRSAQERFDVPWYLLWLIHDAESTLSQNPEAFNPALHYGAMQRATDFYPDSEVEEAAAGLEYLQDLRQNHPDDWKEILWAALKLDRDANDAGINDRLQALEKALESYSQEQEAERRVKIFRILTEIFTYGIYLSS